MRSFQFIGAGDSSRLESSRSRSIWRDITAGAEEYFYSVLFWESVYCFRGHDEVYQNNNDCHPSSAALLVGRFAQPQPSPTSPHFMKTLQFRIAVTWLCFALIGVSLLLGFSHPLLIAACCLVVSTVRRFVSPAFPRSPRWFERLVYMLLLPVIFFFLLGLAFGFVDPWARIARIGLWICLPLLLIFAAYEDAKTWRSVAERN